VTALALAVPVAPAPDPAQTEPTSVADDSTLLRLLGSDFVFWSALKLARGAVFRYVLATPPELVAAATAAEQGRVNALANQVLPVSQRAAGLRDDTGLGRRLPPMALETIRVPTLIASVRDDGFGTFERSRYTASRIPGARFVGFDSGGHLLVGRQGALRTAVAEWLAQTAN
jgi:pimeloyl-ACP methyl ester carboxylesterase